MSIHKHSLNFKPIYQIVNYNLRGSALMQLAHRMLESAVQDGTPCVNSRVAFRGCQVAL